MGTEPKGSRRWFVVAVALALLLAACGSGGEDFGDDASSGDDAPTDGSTESKGGVPHWEAVMLADAAEALTVDGREILRFDGVDPALTAFTDRPDRLTGVLSMREFLTLWHAGVFANDPPNAALVVGSDVAAFELAGAVWDPSQGSLWVSIERLEETSIDGSDVPTGGRPLPAGGPAQLFIDAAPLGIDPQVSDAVTQANVKVVAQSPAESVGLVYQKMSESVGLTQENATAAQESMSQVGQSTDVAAIARILAASD